MWSNSDPISVPLSVTAVPTVKQSDSVCPLHHTSAIQLGSYSQTERFCLSFTPNQCNTTWFLQSNRAILSVLYTIPVQYNLVPTVKQSDSVCPLHQTSAIQLGSHRQRVISQLPYDSSNSISSRVHVVQH